MHRFFAHPKTRSSAACNLRCCGNRFANHIRKGHTAQRMRRYVRHVEQQATERDVQAQLDEQVQDWNEDN